MKVPNAILRANAERKPEFLPEEPGELEAVRLTPEVVEFLNSLKVWDIDGDDLYAEGAYPPSFGREDKHIILCDSNTGYYWLAASEGYNYARYIIDINPWKPVTKPMSVREMTTSMAMGSSTASRKKKKRKITDIIESLLREGVTGLPHREPDLTKINTDTLRSLVSLKRHYGAKDQRTFDSGKKGAEELFRRHKQTIPFSHSDGKDKVYNGTEWVDEEDQFRSSHLEAIIEAASTRDTPEFEVKPFHKDGDLKNYGWRVQFKSGGWSGWHKGYSMHTDAERAAQKALTEAVEGFEAYGVMGMKSKPWRKTFKNQAAFEKWLEKNSDNYEVYGYRTLSGLSQSIRSRHDPSKPIEEATPEFHKGKLPSEEYTSKHKNDWYTDEEKEERRKANAYVHKNRPGTYGYDPSKPIEEATGDKGFSTYGAWKRACKSAGAVKFDGDSDICCALNADGKGVGEWDGEHGDLYSGKAYNESENEFHNAGPVATAGKSSPKKDEPAFKPKFSIGKLPTKTTDDQIPAKKKRFWGGRDVTDNPNFGESENLEKHKYEVVLKTASGREVSVKSFKDEEAANAYMEKQNEKTKDDELGCGYEVRVIAKERKDQFAMEERTIGDVELDDSLLLGMFLDLIAVQSDSMNVNSPDSPK